MMRLAPLLLALVAARSLLAQGGTIVRGTVRDSAGQPLGWATVELSPGSGRLFTDDRGVFAFPAVAPGRHTMRVRRLGYTPRDTTITVGAEPLAFDVALDRLAIALSEVRVVARKGCAHPGPPDPREEPLLAAIFGQLRENADRWLLLARQYPFAARVERRRSARRADATVVGEGTDTVTVAAGSHWEYAPGRVVMTVPGPTGPTRQMNLPGLPELADTNFYRTHCFRYSGIERVRDAEYVRIDFKAADTLKSPDIDGIAYLDTDGYQLRRVVVTLTHPGAVDGAIRELRATTVFREILPAVVIIDGVEGTTSFWESGPRSTVLRTERQRAVAVSWLITRPPGAAVP